MNVFVFCLSKFNGFWFSTEIKRIWFSLRIFKTIWKKAQHPGFVIHFTSDLCWWTEIISSAGIFSSTASRINTLSWVTSDPRCMRSYRLKLDDRLKAKWSKQPESFTGMQPRFRLFRPKFFISGVQCKGKLWDTKRDTWVFWKAWSSSMWKMSLPAEQYHRGLEKDEGKEWELSLLRKRDY